MRLWQTFRKIPKVWKVVWWGFISLGTFGSIVGSIWLFRQPLAKAVKYIGNVLQQFTPLWLFLVLWLVIICLFLWLTKRPRTRKEPRSSVYKEILGLDWEIDQVGLRRRLRALCPKCAYELKVRATYHSNMPTCAFCEGEKCGFNQDLEFTESELFKRVWKEIQRRDRIWRESGLKQA